MKTTIIRMSLFFICVMIGLSCKKDSNTSIVGTWELSSLHEVRTDSSYTPYQVQIKDTTFAHGHSLTLQFTSVVLLLVLIIDKYHTITVTGNYYLANGNVYDFSSGDTGYVNDGRYSVTNNMLTITELGGHPGVSDLGTLVFTYSR